MSHSARLATTTTIHSERKVPRNKSHARGLVPGRMGDVIMELKELLAVGCPWNGAGKTLRILSSDDYVMYDSSSEYADSHAPAELLHYDVVSLESDDGETYNVIISVSSEEIMFCVSVGEYRAVDDLLEEYCDDLKDGIISKDLPFSDWVLDIAVPLVSLEW